MKYFSFLLLFIFIGLAVFGYVPMHHDSLYGMVSCLAKKVLGKECDERTPWGIADFHLSAFKGLSLGIIPGESIAALFVVLILLFAAMLAIVLVFFCSLILRQMFLRALDIRVSRSARGLQRWLMLRENSPNVSSG